MEQFRKIITAFFQGQIQAQEVQSALSALVARDPTQSQPYIQQLNQLYSQGKLPPQLYSMFRDGVLKPAANDDLAVDPLAAFDAAASAQAEAPAAPAPGPESPAEDEGGKTVFRTPQTQTGVDSQADSAAGKTRFRPTTTGHQAPSHTATLQIDPLAPPGTTGATGTGTGTGTGSSWGSPSRWTDGGAGADAGPVGVGSMIKHRFVLKEMIGKGGMGMVFKALDLRKEEAQDRHPYVALKILNEEFKQHPESLKALQREARKAQDLAHPNIVNVFDFDRDGGTVFMTMELLEGTPLDKLVRQYHGTGLPWKEAFPMIKGMSLALNYAHRNHIIHSDFKPGNCFLTKDGTIKVFDFGIARAAKHTGELQGEETKFDAGTLGALTPAYATCEMIDGDEPDQRDDIYALGCTAYELLTGRHPFDKQSAADAMRKKLEPKPIKGLSRSRFKALQRALHLERAKRTKTAFQLLQELDPRSAGDKRVLVGVGSLLVIGLVVAAIILVPNYIYNKKLERIRAGLGATDFAAVSASIASFEEIEPDDRPLLLNSFSDEIIASFDARIGEAFNRELDLYDYPQARELLDRLTALYPDSSRVADIDEQIERDRQELQAQLAADYDAFIAAGQLLPAEGDDIYDLRAIVAQIDPSDPLLSDARLPQGLAVEARAASANDDFDRADRYLAAAFELAPDDADLVNVRDEVQSKRNAIERAAEIAELEAKLQPLGGARATLAAIEDARIDLRGLADLQPNNTILGRVRNNVERLLAAEIQRDLDAREWARAADRLGAFAGVLNGDFATEQNAAIDNRRRAHEDAIAALVGRIDAAITAGQLDAPRNTSAVALFAQLESAGAEADAIAAARDRIASGYIDAAREARFKQDWESARALAGKVAPLAPSDQLISQARSEIGKIDNQETLVEQELRDQEAKGLQARFDERLAQETFGKGDIEAGIRVLAELQEKFGDMGDVGQFVSAGRARITDRVAEQSMDLAQAARWQDATALLTSGEESIGRSAALTQAREQIGQLQRQQASAQLREQIRSGEEALAALLSSAALDDPWQANFDRQVASLEKLEPGNLYAVEARERAASLYLDQARTLREESRWVVAQQQLERAQRLAPTMPAVVAEAKAFESGRAQYATQLAAAKRQADIDAKRQRFSRELDADRVDRAEQLLTELASLLDAGDPFLTETAPAALVAGRLRVAAENASLDRYSMALEQLDLAQRHGAGDPQVAAARSQYQDQRSAFNAAATGDAQKIRSMTVALSRLEAAMDDYAAFEGRLQRALKKRIEARASSNRGDADALYAAAKEPFPTLIVDWPRPAVAAALPPPPETTLQPPPRETVAVVTQPPPPRPQGAKWPGTRTCAGKAPGTGKTCIDGLPGGTKGPTLVVVPGADGGVMAITRSEISVKQYSNYCSQTGACSPGGNSNLPMTNLSAADMQAYADWLTASTGKRYALPTIAQWQHAARAGSDTISSNINCKGGARAGTGYSLESIGTSSDASAWGLRHVVGNAEEVVAQGGAYIAAGGAYSDRTRNCTPDFTRPFNGPTERTGFRLVRDAD